MAVAIRSTTMWKPSEPSSGEKVPLTVFDSAAANTFVAVVFAFHAPAPTNHEMIEGLLRTVSRFPHLAGRLAVDDRSRPCIHLNNAGVVVIEAAASADLADALADDMAASVNELYPTVEKGGADVALFHVQLTRYTCGGMVVGIACHHHVADGHAMNTFFAAWAGEVRGASAMSGSDSPLPFLDRAATAVPRFPPTPSFDHRAVEFEAKNGTNRKSYTILPMDKIKNLTVHFPTEFVTDLKARVGGRCSTFQCLLAHVWKRITEARGLKQEEFTQVRAAVNCRARAKPPVPMDFFGNMVLWAFPRLQVRDLLSSSYTRVVGTIRDAVACVDGEYIHSFVDFGAVADARGEELVATAAKPGTMFCPDLEVDSWLGFGFHDLDFGGGPPCAFLPPDLPVDGLMIFVPSCAAKGGVDLFMAMAKDHVEVFKQICYCLN